LISFSSRLRRLLRRLALIDHHLEVSQQLLLLAGGEHRPPAGPGLERIAQGAKWADRGLLGHPLEVDVPRPAKEAEVLPFHDSLDVIVVVHRDFRPAGDRFCNARLISILI
jgi:hypothetical protein